MSAKNLHAHYVDRRLSIARQQLSMVTNEGGQTLSQVHRQGCVDAALLQTYFAVAHYASELLELYQQGEVKLGGFQLQQILLNYTGSVSELLEWKQLAATSGSWLSILLNLPKDLLSCGSELSATLNSDEAKATVTDASESHLQVVLVEENNKDDTLSKIALTEQAAQWIITECYQLIQRQREHLQEY